MSRCLLHKTKVAAFTAWLTEAGIEHRPGRGEWQLLQVRIKRAWACLYARIDMPEHVTCEVRLEPLVRRFIRESRAALNKEPQS